MANNIRRNLIVYGFPIAFFALAFLIREGALVRTSLLVIIGMFLFITDLLIDIEISVDFVQRMERDKVETWHRDIHVLQNEVQQLKELVKRMGNKD